MKTIDDYQADIIKELKDYYTDETIILADQINKKPKYPFITYKFINKYINEPGREILNNELITKNDKDYWQYNYSKHYNTILSITAFSDNEIEANDKIELIHDYFSFLGIIDLRLKGIVIKDVGEITERDTLIVDDFERRFGFDVEFRLVKKLQKQLELIEEVQFKE